MTSRHRTNLGAAAIVAVLIAIGCRGDQSVAVESGTSEINAFALGFFSGLTIGASDVVVGSLMTKGEVDMARADRADHPDLDTLGKLIGFAGLLFGGWKIYRRSRPRKDG